MYLLVLYLGTYSCSYSCRYALRLLSRLKPTKLTRLAEREKGVLLLLNLVDVRPTRT
eukprot:SAG11_NODE_3645_length_2315_cov_6.776625_4_plen_57_part_00